MMKIKRIISIVLVSLSVSLFQAMPTANAAPGYIGNANQNSTNYFNTVCDMTSRTAIIKFNGDTAKSYEWAAMSNDTFDRARDYIGGVAGYNTLKTSPIDYASTLTWTPVTAATTIMASYASPVVIEFPLPDIFHPNWSAFYVREVEGATKGIASWMASCKYLAVAPDLPGQPTVSAGDGQVTVTIAPPSSGGTPTSYTVSASPQVGGATRTCTVTGSSGSCNVTGLTNGVAYTFTSTATNSGGTSSASTASLSATPIDSTAPTITSVSSSTSNGSYKVGSSIAVTVIFSEAVIVTGTPQLNLETGSTDQIVNYTSGSGTNTLTFNYVVQAGDVSSDLDYFSTTALALNGGAIKDAAAFDAVLTLASPGSSGSIANTKAIIVDTTVPTASLTAATVIGSGNATVQSSEAGTAYLVKSTVSVTSLASITGAIDSLWNSVAVTANTNTNLSVSGLDLGEYVLYVTDAAGNLSAVASNTVTVAMGAPSTPDLNSSSDLGSSSTDNQTADDTPTIDLTGLTTGAVVTVTATPSSGSPVTCSFTATSGSGSCTFSPALGNGTYAFKASQTLSGVTSSDSSNLSSVVIYKTTLTPTVTLDLNTLDDLGSSSTDNITSATTLRITSSSGGVSYTTSGGSGNNSNCTSGCSFGTFSSGVITFTGSATTDTYGNSATPTLQVTVNTGTPTLSSVSASSVAGTTANLNFTSNQEGTYFYLVLAASATAPDAATIIAQGTSVTKGTSSALASTNTVAISGLSESTAYKTYLVVRHPAGGTSAVSNVAMTTTIAVPSVPDLAAGSDLGSSSTDNSTADNTPTVDLAGLTSGASVTVTATPSTGSPVTCTFTASGSTGSCTFSALTNGTYSVKVKQTVGGVDSADSVALTGLVINAQIVSTPATPDLTSGSDLGSSATDTRQQYLFLEHLQELLLLQLLRLAHQMLRAQLFLVVAL
jgi:hypothetical protein